MSISTEKYEALLALTGLPMGTNINVLEEVHWRTLAGLDRNADGTADITPVYGVAGADAGDSIMAVRNTADTSILVTNYSRSIATWLQFLSNRSVEFPKSMMFGVSGDTSTMLASRWDTVLAARPGFILGLIGTNDINSSFGDSVVETFKNNMTVMTNACAQKNIPLFWINVLARSLSTPANDEHAKTLFRMQDWLNKQKVNWRLKNVFVLDVNNIWADPVSATGAPKTGYAYDSVLHPSSFGAYQIANAILPVIQSLYPPVDSVGFYNNRDVYSTTNPTGNLLANGMLTGSGGSYGGGLAGVTGTIPTGMSITGFAAAGGNITGASVNITDTTMSNGIPGKRIVISGTATSSGVGAGAIVQFVMQATSPSTNINPGDILEARAKLEVTSQTNMSGFKAKLGSTESSVIYNHYDLYDPLSDLCPTTFNGTWATPPRTITAAPTAVDFSIFIPVLHPLTAGTIAADFKISQASIRKIIT
jgi:lysophospholipase L1-like esterase